MHINNERFSDDFYGIVLTQINCYFVSLDRNTPDLEKYHELKVKVGVILQTAVACCDIFPGYVQSRDWCTKRSEILMVPRPHGLS